MMFSMSFINGSIENVSVVPVIVSVTFFQCLTYPHSTSIHCLQLITHSYLTCFSSETAGTIFCSFPVFAETEVDLIKRLNEWKNNVENRGMRVNMNKTKVMISGECQKPLQKAARWPCGVCGRGVGIVIQYNILVVRSGYTRSVVV